MTLQQIADYAMEYLDSKDVAAEYLIVDGKVKVVTDNDVQWLHTLTPSHMRDIRLCRLV